jgi:multimeric flavodoxin WrbA
MKNLLIVYQSQSGSTALLAQAVARGASEEADVEIRLRHALEADIADLVWCDGVMIGTPENFGSLSGLIKDFFDRTYYAAFDLQLQRPYALFISAGNDGSGAQRQAERILKGLPWRKIAEPVIVRGPAQGADLAPCEALGQAMAAGLALGIF